MKDSPDDEKQAAFFAMIQHAFQKRKYTGEPYVTHCESVANLVRSVPHTESMLCAAWLHDTVEDTDCTIQHIEDLFGIEIAAMVGMLTDVSKPSDGNRKARKAIDRAHIAKASPEVKTIKLADLIDNSRSIMKHDPDFANVYLAEKRLLLEVLTDGDQTLYAMAKEIVDNAQ